MVKKQQLNSSRGKGNENDGFRGFSATVPRFNLRKKRGKKTMEKLMKLMKLMNLALVDFGWNIQQLVEVARTSWSPALNLDSFVAMNFSGPDILRLQSLVMLGLLLQPQAVPESTSHLKPGDISDSNSSWIPLRRGGYTTTHCQKGRWGEHILRSIMTLYAYKELLNTARQASSCIFRNCGKKKWMIWNWQYCVSAGMIIYKIT